MKDSVVDPRDAQRLYAAAQEPKAATDGNVSSANTMPYIVDAVRAYATVGEICEALREVYGTYTEVSIT